MSSNPSQRHDPPALAPVPPADERRSAPGPRIGEEELEGFEKSLLFVDDLTGLYNRRFLSHLFADRWGDLTGPSERLSLVIVDLDLFKDVNDTYGHLAGDQVLQEIAGLLKRSFRNRDFVIRYGGDEFVVVLPGADQSTAQNLARRARSALAAHLFTVKDTAQLIEVPVSFSLGAASYPQDGDGGEAVLAAADRRLYRDKRRRQIADPGAGRRRRLLTAVVAAALVAALVAGGLYLRRAGERIAGGDPATEGTTATTSVEAELREEILRLQAELEAVPVEHPPSRDVFAEYEARIRKLEARIGELQTELEDRPEPTPEPPPDPAEVEGPAEVEAPPEVAPPADDARTVPAGDSQPPATGPAAGPAADEIATPAGEAAGTSVPPVPRIVRPTPISSVSGRYPAAAVKLRKEAMVLVRVVVDDEGRALRAEVVGKRAGLGFDEAASTAALRALYQPGTRDGEAVEMETLVRVEFKLSD